MSDALQDDIYAKVEELSEQGNTLMDNGASSEAVAVWRQALALLPPPQNRWDAAMWLHASIGDTLASEGRFEEALTHFEQAERSGDGHVNPFVLISLGATLYDLGRKDEATDPLLRAYMLEGTNIFEEFGTQYLDHLRDRDLVK